MKNNLYRLMILGLLIINASCSQKTVSTDDSFEGVELPDGSVVLLNRNSSIVFDKDFEKRNVELTGEAYFDVAAATTPFIITTDLGEVSVLGTKFNVNANEDDLDVEVESGKVELKAGNEVKKLTKGQKGHFNKGKNSIDVGNAKFKFKLWLGELDVEFKKLGKEINKGAKVIGKESKKIGKELEKEGGKLNKKLQKLK